jgi:hypothetical protein
LKKEAPPLVGWAVHADDLEEIPGSVKKEMRKIAKPYDVRFERSEDKSDSSNRLDEII